MDEKDYTANEESYAKRFYEKISNARYMASRFGGSYPCSRTGNKVFFEGFGIIAGLSFKEFSPKQLKLRLEMSLGKEKDKKEGSLELLSHLDDESGGGIISERILSSIVDEFFLPALKQFYTMHN
jgi:hypothetical protein